MLQLLPVLLGSTLAGILLRRSGGDVGQITEVVIVVIGWHPENVRVLFSETAPSWDSIIIERIKTEIKTPLDQFQSKKARDCKGAK